MKKALVTLLVVGTLVGGVNSSFAAATAKPKAKPAATAKEGTAQHEMSESSSTQKNEAKASAKPMATAKAKKK